MPPVSHVAVVACMDARLNPGILGLSEGDAHIIRNAGGVVTDDAVRSLAISQRLLGTTEIILIHHTDCGMLTFKDDDVKDQIKADTGIRPPFALEAFAVDDDDVRQSLARINASPFIPRKRACAASSMRSRRARCARFCSGAHSRRSGPAGSSGSDGRTGPSPLRRPQGGVVTTPLGGAWYGRGTAAPSRCGALYAAGVGWECGGVFGARGEVGKTLRR